MLACSVRLEVKQLCGGTLLRRPDICWLVRQLLLRTLRRLSNTDAATVYFTWAALLGLMTWWAASLSWHPLYKIQAVGSPAVISM